MIRIDGRRPDEVRPLKITKNFIDTASSSFQISIGCTTVMVAIFNRINPEKDKKKLELEFESFGLLLTSEIKNLCKVSSDIILRENLKLLPEYEIIINVFILENDGNLFTVLMNAMSQGLKEIKLWNLKEIIFCGVNKDEKNCEIYIDPSKLEIENRDTEMYYVMIYDLKCKKVKFYEILKSINEEQIPPIINKKKLKRIIFEFGFYLFKLFN